MGTTVDRIRRGALLALVVAGCGGDGGGGPVLDPAERALRRELGVPDAARRVMVVSQSSHLDLNFLRTYDDYWELSVEAILRTALDRIDADPRNRFSISEIAFLRRYWDENPDDRERLRRHVASGAFRIVGGGISSPDTLLPTGESLLRDWLRGLRWAEEHLGVRPTSAWQPDSFGHAETLPSILEHMGFEAVAFYRTDGGGGTVPLEGAVVPGPSTADTLREAGSADFTWRAPDGASVFARWMPFGYQQGDNMDFRGSEWADTHRGFDWNTSDFVDPTITNDRFAGYVDRLDPLRRTPYMLLPVGTDFSYPKPNLLAYVERWNAERYRATGVWFVVATFDDYVRLLAPYRDALPAYVFDMNPYWMGFYSTRIGLKTIVRRAHDALTAAETLGVVASAAPEVAYPRSALDAGWDRSAFMNHHDAITGTTTEESWNEDLIPWAEGSLAAGLDAFEAGSTAFAEQVDTSGAVGDRALVVLNPSSFARDDVVEIELAFPPSAAQDVRVLAAGGPRALATQLVDAERDADGWLDRARLLFRARDVPSVGHRTFGLVYAPERLDHDASDVAVAFFGADGASTDPAGAERVQLSNGRVTATLERASGFCLTSLVSAAGGELLAGASNEVATFLDLGGGYRLGSEIDGPYDQIDSTCRNARGVRLEVLEDGPVRVAVAIRSADRAATTRVVRLAAGAAHVELDTTATPPDLTSVVARFRTPFAGQDVTTSVPFGATTRPRRKLYDPTFWPATAWVDLARADGRGGLWLSAEGSRGWNVAPDGTVEAMLTRNVDGDGLGPPGPDPSPRTTRMHVGWRDGASWRDGGTAALGQAVHRPLRAVEVEPSPGSEPPAASWVALDRDDAEVTALKLAEDGSGDPVLRIVRYAPGPVSVRVTSPLLAGRSAWRANGREEPFAREVVSGESVVVKLERAITTLRFLNEPS